MELVTRAKERRESTACLNSRGCIERIPEVNRALTVESSEGRNVRMEIASVRDGILNKGGGGGVRFGKKGELLFAPNEEGMIYGKPVVNFSFYGSESETHELLHLLEAPI